MKYDGIPLSNTHTWTFGDTTVTLSAGLIGAYKYDPTHYPTAIDLYFAGIEPYPFLSLYLFPRTDSLVIKLNTDSTKRPTNYNIEKGYQVQEFLRH